MGSKRIEATGAIDTAAIRVFSVVGHSGATAGNWALTDGSGGDEFDAITGVISKSARANYKGGMVFPNGLYVTEDNAANCVYFVANYERVSK